MTSFEVRFKPFVEKDLRNLPKSVVERAMKRIEMLANDPLPRQSQKLQGTLHLYRVRVGEYGIVYRIDSRRKLIVIHHVRHRREVYKGL
jgi:mRNA interferase RelE/StbE